jgi:diguanylate cyclase (GGDEF)-like protein
MTAGRATPAKRQVLLGVCVVALVALAPLLVATWTFGRSFQKAEVERTDLKLAATLRASRDDLESLTTQAAAWAARTAGSPLLARELESDTPAVVRFRRGGLLRLRIVAGNTPVPAAATASAVKVRRGAQVLGTVVGDVPLDAALVAHLGRSAEAAGVRLVVVRGGRVVTGAGRRASLAVGPQPSDALLAGERYRVVAFRVDSRQGVSLAALAPRAHLDAAVRRRQEWVLAAGIATIASALLLLAVARGSRRLPWFAGVRRQPSLALVGDAFAATRDADALFPVILHSAVAATGVAGASLSWNGVEVARSGERPRRNAVSFPLRNESGRGELVLAAPSGGLRSSDRELVHSLVRQAEVALESARLHRIVQQQAVTDELTGLANRRRFREALQAEIRRARRFGGSVGLVLLDLDDFKRINDRLGHQAGDRVLAGIGEALRQRVRDTDLAARIGGDELAVLLPHTDLPGCIELAEGVRAAIERGAGWEVSGPTSVTASAGVAVYPTAATEDELLAAADRALYVAKARGRNCVATSQPERPAG